MSCGFIGVIRLAVAPSELTREIPAQMARDQQIEQALHQHPGEIGINRMQREFGPAHPAGESDDVEYHDVHCVGDRGRTEEAQQRAMLTEPLADALKDAVVGELTGDEASGAAEKDHAGEAENLMEVEVRDARGGRQESATKATRLRAPQRQARRLAGRGP